MLFFAVILGFLPSFAWLLFYEEEDPRASRRLIALTFLCGMLFAALTVIPQGALIKAALHFHIIQTDPETGRVMYPTSNVPLAISILFFLALSEEIAKFLAAYVATRKSPGFNQPVDAMLYPVVAALGFAAVENLAIMVGSLTDESPLILGNIFSTISLRFIGATLLHTVASAIVGYFWAISIREFNRKRFIFLGLFLAGGLHVTFNYLIIRSGENAGLFLYAIAFVGLAGFFVLGDFEKLKHRHV